MSDPDEDSFMREFSGSKEDDKEDRFSDEGYESPIRRLKTGIVGLDSMIRGGIPKEFLISIIGPPGTGKTTFGIEFLRQALENDNKAMFIALEQSDEDILDIIDELNWDFNQYIDDRQLSIVDLEPMEVVHNLRTIRRELPLIIKKFGASRLVIDSISVLEMMYDNQSNRRTEIFDFAELLKESGITTLFTSESNLDNPYVSRYGIIEYLTDAVIVARFLRSADFRETRLCMEITKIRNTSHSREMKPYEITENGLSVYRQANIF